MVELKCALRNTVRKYCIVYSLPGLVTKKQNTLIESSAMMSVMGAIVRSWSGAWPEEEPYEMHLRVCHALPLAAGGSRPKLGMKVSKALALQA